MAMLNKKYINRMDYDGAVGWLVRFPRNHKKDPRNFERKFFADSMFEDRAAAKKAAYIFRDKRLAQTKQLHLLDKKLHRTNNNCGEKKSNKRNTSGIMGIERNELNWKAFGAINKKTWTKSFSVVEHSERGAFKAACYERFNRHGPLRVSIKVGNFPCQIPVKYVKIRP